MLNKFTVRQHAEVTVRMSDYIAGVQQTGRALHEKGHAEERIKPIPQVEREDIPPRLSDTWAISAAAL